MVQCQGKGVRPRVEKGEEEFNLEFEEEVPFEEEVKPQEEEIEKIPKRTSDQADS